MKHLCFRIASVTLLMVLIITQQSCLHYYKASTSSIENIKQYNSAASPNTFKYLIFWAGNDVFHMDSVRVSNDGQTITCLLDSLPYEHSLHLTKGIKGKMRYKKYQPQGVVINEIHIYASSDNAAKVGSTYTLTAAKIKKIELLEKDKMRTTSSFVLGGIVYTVGILFVIGIIAAASSSWNFK